MSGIARKLMGVTKDSAPADTDLVLVFDTSIVIDYPTDPTAFQTPKISSDKTACIGINLFPYEYSVQVDWGDGNVESFSGSDRTAFIHSYAVAGVYTVRISGLLPSVGAVYYDESFNRYYPHANIVQCQSFGDVGLAEADYMFSGASNLTVAPSNLPDSALTLNNMFEFATAFNFNIGGWDTSNVISMARMFEGASSFNQDIGSWDVVNVNNLTGMFLNATAFNQNLRNWCVGNFQSEPSSFSAGSSLSVFNKPVWGTCPAYVTDGSINIIGVRTGTTTTTLPSHQAGDVIIAFAFRDGSTSLPVMPSGWTLIDSAAANSCSARLAYRVATSSSTTVGTWTNATTIITVTYRGVDVSGITSLDAESTGFGTLVNYPANRFWQGLSRIVAFAGHRSTNTLLGTAPGDLTLIANPVDTVDEAAAFHSVVDDYGSWSSTQVSVGGTSSGWITFTLRLRVPITLAP